MKPHPNVVNVRFAHIMGFCSEGEEYFCFEDFVTGRNLGDLVVEGEGGLYDGTTAEVRLTVRTIVRVEHNNEKGAKTFGVQYMQEIYKDVYW